MRYTDKIEKFLYPLIAIIAFFGFLVTIFIGNPVASCRLHRDEYDSVYKNNTELVYGYYKSLNDRSISRTAKVDSIIADIVATQQIILKRQEDLVNDIRQETNNSIDKINMILSFWLGMMAIFGVAVPLVMDHLRRKESERDLERQKKEVDEKARKLENEIGKERKAVENLRLISELNAISLNIEERIIPETGDKRSVTIDLWNRSNEKFRLIVEQIFGENESEDNRIHLMECLVGIYSTLNAINRHMVTHRSRSLYTAIDQIKELMKVVYQRTYFNWGDLHQSINGLIRTLRSVEFD